MQEARTAEDAEVISLRLGGLISVSQVTPKLSTPYPCPVTQARILVDY